MERRMAYQEEKLSDHKRLIMLCAKNDVKSLRRILTSALKRGANPQNLISYVERAIAGVYSPLVLFTGCTAGTRA